MGGFDYQAKTETAAPAPVGRTAPGKRTRTQDLPPKAKEEQPEIVMTGYPLLDEGLYCDGQEGETEGCFLDPRASQRLFDMIQTRAHAVCTNYMAAIGNVRLELLIGKGHNWNGAKEIIFMLLTNAAIGPLAGTMAQFAAWNAAELAVRGSVKAAWAVAGVDAAKIAGGLTLASKGLRTQIVHSGGRAPATQVEFTTYLQSLVDPVADNILQSIAAKRLDHNEMLELLARLNDPSIVGVEAIMARVRTLVEQFDDNRIGTVGNVMDLGGGYKVAEPVRVKFKRDEYVVLCESFGVHNSALALNGANLGANQGKAKQTMEGLVFVRMVERPFHGLVEAEYAAKTDGQPMPFVDFNKASERGQHRWFDSMYVDLLHRTDKQNLTIANDNQEDDADAAVAVR